MASCRSSTAESASDVLLSHLFHLPSVCLFVCCVLFGVWVVLFVLFASRVSQVLGLLFDLKLRMLDDRPCLIARSATQKKK